MSITLGGKRASELQIAVLIDSQEPALPSTRDRTLEIPGRHGVYDFGADLGPRLFELSCKIVKDTPYALQLAVRNLAAHLLDGSGRPRTLELIFDEEPDKVYYVRYSGSLSIQRLVGLGRFTLPLMAFDPFAYSLNDVSTIRVDSGISVDSDISVDSTYDFTIIGPQTVKVDNYGNQNVRPRIEITGSFTSLSLTVGTTTLSYNAAMSGQTLVIDCEKYTAKIGATSKLGDVTGDFFELPVGLTSVSVGGTGLSCQITFKFKTKYI